MTRFTINDEEFIPTFLKITDTGTCLEIRLADDGQDIVIFIRNTNIGSPQSMSYINEAFESSDRQVMALVHALDGHTYKAHSGEVNIFADNTLVSGKFAFDATSGDLALSVRNGRIPIQGVSLVESPSCREFLTIEGSNWTNFWYDSRGFLIARRIGSPFSTDIASSTEYYYNIASQIDHVVNMNEGIRQGIDVEYDVNMRVTSLNFYTPSTKVVEFAYDDQGLLIEADGQCITYNGGNVVQVGCRDAGPSHKYSQFDDKVNPGKLFLQALQNQPALVYYFLGEDGVMLSQNNPLLREMRPEGEQEFIKETLSNVNYGPEDLPNIYQVERLGNSYSAGHQYFNCFP